MRWGGYKIVGGGGGQVKFYPYKKGGGGGGAGSGNSLNHVELREGAKHVLRQF